MRAKYIKFKLQPEQMSVLSSALENETSKYIEKIPNEKQKGINKVHEIKITTHNIEKIRDMLTIKLAKVGFDEKYSLTKDGIIIEDLISILQTQPPT
jgi:hypothetical protein